MVVALKCCRDSLVAYLMNKVLRPSKIFAESCMCFQRVGYPAKSLGPDISSQGSHRATITLLLEDDPMFSVYNSKNAGSIRWACEVRLHCCMRSNKGTGPELDPCWVPVTCGLPVLTKRTRVGSTKRTSMTVCPSYMYVSRLRFLSVQGVLNDSI